MADKPKRDREVGLVRKRVVLFLMLLVAAA
jgi:hypothetical protein